MLIFVLILVFMLVVVKMQFGIRGKYVVIMMMMYVAGVMVMVVHDNGLWMFILRMLMLMPMVMTVFMVLFMLMMVVTMFMAVIMTVLMAMVMIVMVSVLMMMAVIVMIVAFNALFASRATASSTHKFSPENYSISICLICMLSPLSTRRLWLWQCGHPASCADTVMA